MSDQIISLKYDRTCGHENGDEIKIFSQKNRFGLGIGTGSVYWPWLPKRQLALVPSREPADASQFKNGRPDLDGSGRIWMNMDGYGRIWADLGGFVRIWTNLDGFGRIWTYLDGSGRIGADLLRSGQIGADLHGSGQIWMDLEGFGLSQLTAIKNMNYLKKHSVEKLSQTFSTECFGTVLPDDIAVRTCPRKLSIEVFWDQ